jgi:signal transduction histidine kinase
MHAQERSLYLAILITVFVLFVLLVFYSYSLIRQHRRSRRLFREKVAAEIHTLEKERRRLAEDMHDELGPVVAGIKLKLNSIDALSDIDKETLDKVQENMSQLLNRLRAISNNLMPAVLMKKGLAPALKALIDEFQGTQGLHIKMDFPELPKLTPEISTNLYRICQEILGNTLKHSKATELDIRLTTDGDLVRLETKDNGIGFDQQEAATRSNSYGLHNLLNRTELIGGRMFLETMPGKGTAYVFEIPVGVVSGKL